MTEAHRHALRAYLREISWGLIRPVTVSVVFVLAAVGGLLATGDRRILVGAVAVTILSLVVVAVIYVTNALALWSDIHDTSLYRATGVLTAAEQYGLTASTTKLDVDGESLRSPWSGRNKAPFLKLERATVEFSRRAKFVLSIIDDDDGRSVYRPGRNDGEAGVGFPR